MSARALLSRRQPPLLADEPAAGNYFVAAYPPFSAWQPSQTRAVEKALQRPPSPQPIGLYVHLPFCRKKCDYCYYLSYVGQTSAVVDRYLDALVQELALYGRQPAVAGRPVSFVYFGGGTPSTLSVPQVRRLIAGLRDALPWNGVEEVTFECAPRSVRPDFLRALRESGVTRVSMGVQSFDNTLLKLNGRIHLAEDARRAYARIRQTGFDWVNLDLMVGLLGETWTHWEDSVRQMIELAPESVTVYQTEIPHNTRLYRGLKTDSLPAPLVSWKEKRERLSLAFRELTRAGYTVVSAYAAVRDPARHRFLYQHYLWRGGDMLGLGVASFGYLGGVHYQNAATLERYQQGVERGGLPLQRAFRLTNRDQCVREFILRLKWGEVPAAELRQKFGEDIIRRFAGPLRALATAGLLSFSEAGVRLTETGLLCVDRLLPWFYDPEYREIPYT